MYQIIDKQTMPKRKQYEWFRTFTNPCYGVNVKMDVTNLVAFTKETKTSFFINALFLITKGLNSIIEMRMREVRGEIRLYDVINPTFTVMTEIGVFENAGFKMIDDYHLFYQRADEVIEATKKQNHVKETYNNNQDYDDYYMTTAPWLSIESMTHPLPDNNIESSSCPRVAWDKYREENGHLVMLLNVTVNHCFVDGYPLSQALIHIQDNFDKIRDICH